MMAALSKLTGLSDRTSLLLLSFVPSLLAVLLARKLWGGWIAGYFAVLNFDWLQRSCLGGSEPLFVCLLLAAFLSVRRQRWLLASLLASLATIVRPLGVFALVGIGLTLLWRRDFRKFAAATAIGLAVGILYAIPLATHFGDPMATVSSYHDPKWAGGWLFGFPFYAIIKGTLLYPAPWTNLVLSFGWIFLVIVACVVMVRSAEFREHCRAHSVEALFLAPYLWCLFAYNYPVWARGNFARFAIPILPFVLLALCRWIPKDRRLLWALGVVSPLLAACSAIGIVNVAHMIRAAIR
jgi:Gpi18-like mannosyltransferase